MTKSHGFAVTWPWNLITMCCGLSVVGCEQKHSLKQHAPAREVYRTPTTGAPTHSSLERDAEALGEAGALSAAPEAGTSSAAPEAGTIAVLPTLDTGVHTEAGAPAIPEQCELDVVWASVEWSSPTCLTLSSTTGMARATWNGFGLQFDTARPHLANGDNLSAAFSCYLSDGTWRYVETLALEEDAPNLCNGDAHTLTYAYQECRVLWEIGSTCLITEDACSAEATLMVKRARYAPTGPTTVPPENLSPEAACYGDPLPKRDGELCGDSSECNPGSYCDVSGDAQCFLGACTQAPQYLACGEVEETVCDCTGYPVPPEVALNNCQAQALGITTRACPVQADAAVVQTDAGEP